MRGIATVLLVCFLSFTMPAAGFCQKASAARGGLTVKTLESVQGEITVINKGRKEIVIKDAGGKQWLFRVSPMAFDSLRIGMTVTVSHLPGSMLAKRVRFEQKLYRREK